MATQVSFTAFWNKASAGNNVLNRLDPAQSPTGNATDTITFNNGGSGNLGGGDFNLEGTDAANVDPDTTVTINGVEYYYYLEGYGSWPTNGKVPSQLSDPNGDGSDADALTSVKIVLVAPSPTFDPLGIYDPGATYSLDGEKPVFTLEEQTSPLDFATLYNLIANGNITLVLGTLNPPVCFAKGTLILTDHGQIAIENLAVGALIRCQDGQFRPAKWIGHTTVRAVGSFAPIVFAKGAIGNESELILSPQHRVYLSGWKAEVLFGETEILVKAKDLVNGDTIYRRDGGEITYYHVLLNGHHIIYANGAPAESLYLGEQTMAVLDDEGRQEIISLFPELAVGALPEGHKAVCLPTLRAYEASALNA